MKTLSSCVAALLLSASVAQARQATCTTPAVTYQDYWCVQLQAIRSLAKGQKLDARLEIEKKLDLSDANLKAFLLYAQSKAGSFDLRPLEDARIDKQVGAPANSAGSTSVVSKGSVPSILGFAVENGALTQSVSQTAVTLRGNLVGWLDLVRNQGFIASYQDDSAFVRKLRSVSYSFTFNTDSSTTAVEAPSGLGALSPDAIRQQLKEAGQQLSGYSVRLAIVDQRNPRTAKNREAVATMLGPSMRTVLKSNNFLDPAWTSDEYNYEWIPETARLLDNPDLDEKRQSQIFYRQLETMRQFMVGRIENFDAQVVEALEALDGFKKARVKVFQAMQKRPLFALEYVNTRDKTLPDKHTMRAILEGQWGPRIDLTANASWSMQKALTPQPSDSTSLRDFQVAVQMEVPLASAEKAMASTSGIGVPSFAIAYLLQDLKDKAAVTFAGNTFTLEKGVIHVGQAKLTIPVKGGMKIPLSISFANRTELLKEKTIRGQVGLTFDLDVLSSLRR